MNGTRFCPPATAAESLTERWTILILRGILIGGRRFNSLQGAPRDMCPALLTKRLEQHEQKNMDIRRKIPDQKDYGYDPSDACEAQ